MRSTAATVQHGLLLGNLILLVSPWKCLCLLSEGVVLLPEIARPHMAQQARNLLQTSG